MRTITTRAQAEGLVQELSMKRLLFPAVVVTSPRGAGPLYEPAALESAVGDAADLYFVEDSDVLRRALEEMLPASQLRDFRVFGGAVRVYPAGDWKTSPELFLAYDKAGASARIPDIVRHLHKLAGRGRGAIAYSTSGPAPKQADALRALELEEEVRRLTNENATLRQQLSTPRPRPLKAQQAQSPNVRGRLFLDGAQEISHRALVLWAESTTPQQKQVEPMPALRFAEHFGASVDDIGGSDEVLLERIARAVLNVARGRSRDAHKFGFSRDDGAVLWRAYVEQKTPSARRLHYFRLPDGGLEFSRIVVHDDYTP